MNQLLDKQPMKDITREYLEKMKKELNCVGIFLIISDSELPCPDSRAGEDCPHGHEVTSALDGMSAMAATEVCLSSIQGHVKNLIKGQ